MSTQHEVVYTHKHVSPKVYFIVFALLLLGLAITIPVAYVNLGWFNLPVAMLIATIKASLVIWYFMHMREMPRMVLVLFGASFIMAAIGAILTFCDYLTRY